MVVQIQKLRHIGKACIFHEGHKGENPVRKGKEKTREIVVDAPIFVRVGGMTISAYLECGIAVRSEYFGPFDTRLNVGDSFATDDAMVEVIKINRISTVVRITSEDKPYAY